MKILAFIIFLTWSNSILGQTISFREYFPLKNGKVKVFYVSHITHSDTIRDKNDSSFCKSLIIKGREIFYFDDESNSSDTTIIGSRSFCMGVFYYDNGKFMFSPLFWKYELKAANLDYFEPLFPNVITLDKIYKFQDGEEKRKYQFNGFEDVQIKNNLLKHCLKLTIIQDWKTEKYIDLVWFQKGTGVVKWLRATGRLEEIKL
jgi:hypothetical protein